METKLNATLLVTRVVLATVVLAHGIQKLLGWFGGYGFDGTMTFFTQTIGLPYLAGLAIILAESLGMVVLLLGWSSRILAGVVVLIMLGAIVTVHFTHGFFMNWGGTLSGEGYEFHLLAIGLAVPTLLLGGGRYSLDHYRQKMASKG